MGIIGDLVKQATDVIYGVANNASQVAASDLLAKAGLAKTKRCPDIYEAGFSQRWYQIYPYEFVVLQGDISSYNDCTAYRYSLPIPPESISISMISASAVTPTIGGVVEETNENVFWNIQLSGTTGMAVNRADSADNKAKFRKAITTTGLFSGVSNVLNTIDNFDNSVGDAASSLDPSSLGNAIDTGLNFASSLLLPKLVYSKSAVDGERNGYTEIQELTQFLYAYSILKGKEPNNWRLYFINHKDKQRWRVVVAGAMGLLKSAGDPFMWKYSIPLRGWGMRTPAFNADEEDEAAINRFAPGGDLQPVNLLTITGAFTAMKGIQTDIIKTSKNPVKALNIVPPII